MDPSCDVRLSVNWEEVFFSRAKQLHSFRGLDWIFFLTSLGILCSSANKLSHYPWEKGPYYMWETGWCENYLFCWQFWDCWCFFRCSHLPSFRTFVIPLLFSEDKDDQSWDNSLNYWATDTLFLDREVLLNLVFRKNKKSKIIKKLCFKGTEEENLCIYLKNSEPKSKDLSRWAEDVSFFSVRKAALQAAEAVPAVRKSLAKHKSTQPFTENIGILQGWVLRWQGGSELCWHLFSFVGFLPFEKMDVENWMAGVGELTWSSRK